MRRGGERREAGPAVCIPGGWLHWGGDKRPSQEGGLWVHPEDGAVEMAEEAGLAGPAGHLRIISVGGSSGTECYALSTPPLCPLLDIMTIPEMWMTPEIWSKKLSFRKQTKWHFLHLVPT